MVRQAEGHSTAQFLSQFNLSQGKLRAPSGNPVLRFQWEWCRGFVEDGGAKQRTLRLRFQQPGARKDTEGDFSSLGSGRDGIPNGCKSLVGGRCKQEVPWEEGCDARMKAMQGLEAAFHSQR